MSKNQLRSSQVVTTFGPGAMVDLPDTSVIIAGLDSWKYDFQPFKNQGWSESFAHFSTWTR